MRTRQVFNRFALGVADRVVVDVSRAARVTIQAIVEVGTWSNVTLTVKPVIGNVAAAFPSAVTLTNAAPAVQLDENDTGGINAIEIAHSGGGTLDSATFLTIQVTTDETDTQQIQSIPDIAFTPDLTPDKLTR